MSQANQNTQSKLEIQKIYLTDCSWEAPHSPESFSTDWKPEIHVEIKNSVKPISTNQSEVKLHLQITCKNNKKIAFIVEIEQAALFLLENIGNEDKQRLLGTVCPNAVFPYVRETVDSLVVKGGFPPVMLAPINFDQLYNEAKKQQEQTQKQQEHKPLTH